MAKPVVGEVVILPFPQTDLSVGKRVRRWLLLIWWAMIWSYAKSQAKAGEIRIPSR